MSTAPFSSTLATGSFLALRRSGFEPIGQVMGTCVYHVGWTPVSEYPSPYQQLLGGGSTWQGGWTELSTPTAAWNEARTLALGRLRDEARSLGAIAVVDVAYRRIGYDWATGAIEIVAVGTAVRSSRFTVDESEAIPLTNLSGEDVWKLLESGWWPLGIVAGSTVVYVLSSYQTAQAGRWLMGTAAQNQELEDYTNGLYEARDLALRHVRRDAAEVGASGVIGLSLEHAFSEREVDRNGKFVDLIITIHALGTGVVAVDHGSPARIYYALETH
jgi:uncharacterized protein YbjQ (UPF0145 family)